MKPLPRHDSVALDKLSSRRNASIAASKSVEAMSVHLIRSLEDFERDSQRLIEISQFVHVVYTNRIIPPVE
jgi:hypothetical protein